MKRPQIRTAIETASSLLQRAVAQAQTPNFDLNVFSDTLREAQESFNAALLGATIIDDTVKSYVVRFSVTYETMVSVDHNETIGDAIADIDIPEKPGCRYIDDSFEALSHEDLDTGERIDLRAGDDNGGFLT